MKRLLMILLSALLVAGINGCGSSDTKTGTSAVTINLSETKTASPSGQILSASSIPTAVASVRFTISAPDMATIERTVSVEGRTSISETFDVPNGANRHFLAEAMDAAGNVLYKGETYANLDGTPITIAIPMVSDVTPLITAAKAALENQDVPLAKAKFQEAYAADPNNKDANFGVAITEGILLLEDPGVVSILNKWDLYAPTVKNVVYGAMTNTYEVYGGNTLLTTDEALRKPADVIPSSAHHRPPQPSQGHTTTT